MGNDRVVTSKLGARDQIQPHDDAPIGKEQGKVRWRVVKQSWRRQQTRLRAMPLNVVHVKQDTHTGPNGLIKIKSIESNTTNWVVKRFRTLRGMLPPICDLSFLNLHS